MPKHLFAVLALLLSLPSYSFGAEPEGEPGSVEELLFYDLEELVSVSFFRTDVKKAPGYSYIIKSDQIEGSPARTLRDIIEMRVPGMTTGGHERHGPLIGTRGIFIDNNAKTMVMLDEQQINQRSQFGYTSGLVSPLLGDLKQVEFILGPGAILHGSGALNGFINLVPKNGKDNSGLFFSSEYGFAEQLWKLEMGYGASYGEDRNIYLYAGAYDAEGYEPDKLYGFSKTFDINAKGFGETNYRVSTYWNHDNFNLNTFFYENNPYKNNSSEIGYFHQTTLGIRPKYLFEINATDALELTLSFLWSDHSDHRILTGGGSEEHRELKTIYKTTRWKDHALAVGVSAGEKEFNEKDQFFSEDADIEFEIVETKWEERSIFGEDVIALSDTWTASFGLRYDKIYLDDMFSREWLDIFIADPARPAYKNPVKNPDPIEGHYSPRIATAYDLDENTTVKASYQHGFRAPDAAYYSIYMIYKDAADALGFFLPPLEIETLDSYELNFQKNFPGKKVKLVFNVFYNVFDDLLSFTLYRNTGLFTPEQLEILGNAADPSFPPDKQFIGSFLNAQGIIRNLGGEIGMTFRPIANIEVRPSYGYVTSNVEMKYPMHQVKLNTLSYFLNNRLLLALDYLYNSRYKQSDLTNAHPVYRRDRHVVDAAIKYFIRPDLQIGVTGNNIFEEDVPPMVFEPDKLDRGGLGFDERRVYVMLTLRM